MVRWKRWKTPFRGASAQGSSASGSSLSRSSAKGAFVLGALVIMLLAFGLILTSTQRTSGSLCIEGDLDADDINEEYSLYRNQVTVREGQEIIWRTPGTWSVTSFYLGDVDNDGSLNLVMSLWKKGSFGDAVPFWQEGEDVSYKNHLFVYRLVDEKLENKLENKLKNKLESNTFKPIWCSSNLDRPIHSFSVRDINSDGLVELVVREGQYRRLKGERFTLDTHRGLVTTVWQWNQWGFEKLPQ